MGQVSQSIWAKMLNYIHPKETVTTFTDVGVRFKCDKLILVVKAKKKRLQDLVIKLEADLLK